MRTSVDDGLGRACKESETLFACYTRGQLLRTSSPVTKSKCLPSPDTLGGPYLYSTAPSPVTPQQVQAAQQALPLHSATTASSSGGRNLRKELSPGVFYGSPAGKPAKTPNQVQRLLQQICLDRVPSHKEELRTPASATWATFPRQDQAIQFADGHGTKNVAVFVFQDHITGQRRFLGTTLEEFWKRYEKMPPPLRHHYELVREGLPCHLYFDLEFNRKANPEANGQTMVDLLLSTVAEAFEEVYSLKYCSNWTVELDSSTEAKFSRHVIVRAPNVAFKDNSHVGGFVNDICTRIEKLRGSKSKFETLFVLKGDSRSDHHTELFVDKGVYSRNRSFRLPFSSKAGKTAVLQATNRFRCHGLNDREVFMDSLICRIDEDCNKLLTIGLEVPDRGRALDFTSYHTESVLRQPTRGTFNTFGKSPFPNLDVVVETIASVDNVPGSIRSWYWFSEYGVMVYNIWGNRYCENIGRQHKSNNVMYIIDFRTAGYYQKCHDPDCRGYRSPLRPIPRDVIPPNFTLSTANSSQSGPSQCSSQVAPLSCDSTVPIAQQLGQEKSAVSVPGKENIVPDTQQSEQVASQKRAKAETEDESWWDAVISSMASIECSTPLEIAHRQDPDALQGSDESWWLAVESVAADVEAKIFASSLLQLR